jgi:lysophospholipase L1-like esterase
MGGLEQAFLWTAAALLAWSVFSTAPSAKPGLPPPTTEASCFPPGSSVVLIGDSLSVGMGEPMATLAASCGTPFVTHAKIGTSVTQWAQDSWITPVLALHPSVILVSLGANDFGRGDHDNVVAAIQSLVQQVRSSGARLFWIEPLTMPFPDKIGVEDAWKSAVGADWYPSALLDIPRSPDHIHPTGAGYVTFATAVWRWAAGRMP